MRRHHVHLFLLLVGILCFFMLSHSAIAAPDKVKVAGGGMGGTFYVWAIGWSQILKDKMKIEPAVEVTAGPVANFKLIASKQADFGIVTMGPAWEGYNGKGWANGKKYSEIRVIFPAFASYVHWFCAADSGIKTVHDFTGKNICIGPSGTTSATYGKLIFELLDIKPAKIVYSPFSDAANAMKDKLLDASLFVGGLPMPAVTEFSVSEKSFVGGFTGAEADKIVQNYPFFSKAVLPAGIYRGQENPVPSLSMWNAMLTHSAMSDDFIYQLVKNTFDNLEIVIKAHKSAEEVRLENTNFVTSIPMHPGAIKYFEEKGVKLPASAYPEGYKK